MSTEGEEVGCATQVARPSDSQFRAEFTSSFEALKCYLRTEWRSNLTVRRYEVEVAKVLREVLHAVEGHLASCNPRFRLGRAIAYLNSPVIKARIRIPLFGGTATGDRLEQTDRDGKDRNVWSRKAREGNERSLMFFRPDEPTHLLTEHTWRLRPDRSWGKGHALCVFQFRDDQWTFIEHAEDRVFSVHAGASRGVCKTLQDGTGKSAQEARAQAVAEYLGYSSSDALWLKLAGDLNSRCRFLVANNAASPDVPIVEYTKEHARKLFMRPLQLLHKLQLEGSPGANIFYLSDVCQTEFMGGIDAEIVPSPAVNGDKEHTEIAKDLTAFLEEIQWVVSQYVLHLVSAAERGHQVEGDVYAEAYFGRWPKGEPGADYHGLRDMLSLFEQMQKGIGGNNAFAREAIEVVGNHLRLAGGTIGEYWRGYDRWAFEVACTVARLFHCLLPRLFPGGDGGTTITDIVQGSSGRLRTLDSLLAEQPFLVRQLFRGLSAEDELFALPLYREHFVHSFHVFMLGLVFLYWRPQEVFPGESLAAMGRGQADVLVRRWFLVSMWHDIAYSLEKGRELAERHIHRLLGKERVRRFRGLLPSMPSLGHLFQVEQLIETLEDATSSPLDANESKRNPPMFAMHNELRAAGIRIRDVVSAVAFDRADHGIWSALLLAHALTCPCHQLSDRSAWDLIGRDLGGDGGRANQMTGLGVLALAKAVMPHHVYSWDWPSMLETFYSCPEAGVRGQFPEATITGANHPLESQFRTAHLSVMDNELGYLLVLTDVLGQLGREASEKASDVPSALNIKLIRFLVSGDPPHVTAVFHYGGRKDGGLDPNKMLKYYGLPALYLGLDMAKDTLEGEIRGDELWLSDGSGSTARPLKPGRLYIAVVTDRDMPRLQIKVRVCTLKS